MIPLLFAAAIQISVPAETQKGSIESPTTLRIALSYPKEQQPLKGSIRQSIAEQNAPLPSPFLVIDESYSKPRYDDEWTQTATLKIQPRMTGKSTLLLKTDFKDDQGNVTTVFASPIEFDISSSTVAAPLLPLPYIPEKEPRSEEYSTRVGLLKEMQAESHAEEIEKTLDERSISWWEIILSLFLILGVYWAMAQRMLSSGPPSEDAIVTRFGLRRKLRQLAQELNTTSEQFYTSLEDGLKGYLHIPKWMTMEESKDYLERKHLLPQEKKAALDRLSALSAASKFGKESPSNYSEAIGLLEIILE